MFCYSTVDNMVNPVSPHFNAWNAPTYNASKMIQRWMQMNAATSWTMASLIFNKKALFKEVHNTDIGITRPNHPHPELPESSPNVPSEL